MGKQAEILKKAKSVIQKLGKALIVRKQSNYCEGGYYGNSRAQQYLPYNLTAFLA